mmetsp:Transcript_10613/g.30012  ORF Transcript_10613/g.30012 Transcript_10613/m.30012 type:complete len:212 (-) Transcript_10613:305-940(-)
MSTSAMCLAGRSRKRVSAAPAPHAAFLPVGVKHRLREVRAALVPASSMAAPLLPRPAHEAGSAAIGRGREQGLAIVGTSSPSHEALSARAGCRIRCVRSAPRAAGSHACLPRRATEHRARPVDAAVRTAGADAAGAGAPDASAAACARSVAGAAAGSARRRTPIRPSPASSAWRRCEAAGRGQRPRPAATRRARRRQATCHAAAPCQSRRA